MRETKSAADHARKTPRIPNEPASKSGIGNRVAPNVTVRIVPNPARRDATNVASRTVPRANPTTDSTHAAARAGSDRRNASGGDHRLNPMRNRSPRIPDAAPDATKATLTRLALSASEGKNRMIPYGGPRLPAPARNNTTPKTVAARPTSAAGYDCATASQNKNPRPLPNAELRRRKKEFRNSDVRREDRRRAREPVGRLSPSTIRPRNGHPDKKGFCDERPRPLQNRMIPRFGVTDEEESLMRGIQYRAGCLIPFWGLPYSPWRSFSTRLPCITRSSSSSVCG